MVADQTLLLPHHVVAVRDGVCGSALEVGLLESLREVVLVFVCAVGVIIIFTGAQWMDPMPLRGWWLKFNARAQSMHWPRGAERVRTLFCWTFGSRDSITRTHVSILEFTHRYDADSRCIPVSDQNGVVV